MVFQIILVDPSALAGAAENLIHNNLSMNARFVNAFISDKCDETVEFYSEVTGAADNRYKGFAKTAASGNSHFKINTLNLDYLITYYQMIPGLVNVDVEGAEREVLRGPIKLAPKAQTFFFVEIHSGHELSITKNTYEVLDCCNQVSYTAWCLKTNLPLELGTTAERDRYHALLIPTGSKLPPEFLEIKEKRSVANYQYYYKLAGKQCFSSLN